MTEVDPPNLMEKRRKLFEAADELVSTTQRVKATQMTDDEKDELRELIISFNATLEKYLP